MAEETQNFTHSGLDKNIRLGKSGILIKNIDDNNGVSFKSPNDGKLIVVRGADAVRDNDLVTKRQLDSYFEDKGRLKLETTSTNIIQIGAWNIENFVKVEYTLNYIEDEYQCGIIYVLVNETGTNIAISHENLFIQNLIENIEFNVICDNEKIMLEITNNSIDKHYEFIYSTGGISKYKLSNLSTQNLIISNVGDDISGNLSVSNQNLIISNLPHLSGDIDCANDYLVIEDESDKFLKKRVNLNYIKDKLTNNLTISNLEQKNKLDDNDIIVIEDSAQDFIKKKVVLAEILDSNILNSMSFNA